MRSRWGIIATLALFAQIAAAAERGAIGSDLRISLRLDGDSVAERGAATLQLTALNAGDKDLRAGLVVLPFHERYFQIFYRRLSEPPPAFKALTYPAAWHRTSVGDPPLFDLALAPGRSRVFAMTLAVNPGTDEFLFPEAGEYELKAVARLAWLEGPRTIETPVLRLHVSRALTSDSESLSLWDPALGYLAHVDGGHGGPNLFDLLPRAEEMIRAFPGSSASLALQRGLLANLPSYGNGLNQEQRRFYETLKAAERR